MDDYTSPVVSERDGFTITVRRVLDMDPDLSWIGEYGDKPHGDPRLSVDVWAREYGCTDGEPMNPPHCYRWFNPAFGGSENPTLDKLMAEYAPMFLGDRNKAYRQIMRERMEDYRRMQDYGNGWSMLGVVVTASRNGVDLGSASCWGIESDSDEMHFESIEADLTVEAIETAKGTLSALCEAI